MGILSWLLLGLLAGVLAKLIMPGKDPGRFVVTILIGIAGAFLGGWIGSITGLSGPVTDFSLASLITATGGALLLLAGYRLIQKKR